MQPHLNTESLYFIALLLPQQLSAAVDKIKHDVAANFESKAALRSPPHITLHMPFRLPEKKKTKLHILLENFALNHSPFDVDLRNFNVFAPRVIYIDVAPSDALDNLHITLIREMRREMQTFNGDYKTGFHPHITIAFRDLKPKNFRAAWEVYQKETFSSRFIASQISLLKHNGQFWEVDEHYSFSQAT